MLIMETLKGRPNVRRETQRASRDAKCRIDWYYKTTILDTLPYKDSGVFFKPVLEILDIDETFNWKERLKDSGAEYQKGDFTIGFCLIQNGYYFKHKGIINTLIFTASPKVVDYTDPAWIKYKGIERYYYSVENLIHNMHHYMRYCKILP